MEGMKVKEKYLKFTRMPQSRCIILVMMLIFIYIMQNYTPIIVRDNFIFIYILKPLMWLLVIAIILYYPRIDYGGKLRVKNTLIWTTILAAFIYVVILLISGAIWGFAKSPYDHSLFGNLLNTITIFSVLFGREMTRSYIINSLKKRNIYFIIGLIAIFMTLLELPVNTINNLKVKIDVVTYFGEIFLPKLGVNVFACYLVYLGGSTLSIIYVGILEGFMWYFPAIPNPGWNIKVLIDILLPIFSFMFIQYFYSKNVKDDKSRHIRDENPLGWVITTIVSILIIWFAAGVFPVQPFVVATGSMEPVIYPGDVVLVEKIDIHKIKTGDIIQYEKQNVYIFHRLINVVEEDKEIKYQTKGDNNSAIDFQLVKAEQIKGKVVSTIPKIGWPTLLLKRNKDFDKKEVEFLCNRNTVNNNIIKTDKIK